MFPYSRGILFSSFMNLSFSLEKASSFSPAPGPAMLLVVLALAMDVVVVAGAANASRRLSFIAATLGSQVGAAKQSGQERG